VLRGLVLLVVVITYILRVVVRISGNDPVELQRLCQDALGPSIVEKTPGKSSI
jgi:hypothetical protein